MTPARTALGLVAIAFIAAEIARPTHIPAKKLSAHALVVRPQTALHGIGVYDSLDPNLLDDLPRIHPDAVDDTICSIERDGSFRLFGSFFGGDDGSAVFVINDGVRLGAEATIFAYPGKPHTFIIEIPPKDLGPGKHRLYVALVSSDQRGFFLGPRAVAATVGASSIESSDCRKRRPMLDVGV